MIQMFNIPSHTITTGDLGNVLHGPAVTELEERFADYVGAKYACSLNSATSAIFLLFKDKRQVVRVPSMLPPVVVNALLTSGNTVRFTDDINWIGHSYVLHQFPEYKVIDSAQKLEKNQFKECENQDVMIFSFYPTKPLGGIDGGMVVTNDYIKHKRMKELSINGMEYSENSWDRNVKFPGYKMYMNSFQAEIILKNFNSFERKMQVLGDIVGLYNQELGYGIFSRHLYRIEVHNNIAFINAMKKDGIACGIHYAPLHLHPTYKHLTSISIDELPEIGNSLYVKTEEVAPHTVSLPMNETMTKQDIQHVISSARKHDARLE